MRSASLGLLLSVALQSSGFQKGDRVNCAFDYFWILDIAAKFFLPILHTFWILDIAAKFFLPILHTFRIFDIAAKFFLLILHTYPLWMEAI